MWPCEAWSQLYRAAEGGLWWPSALGVRSCPCPAAALGAEAPRPLAGTHRRRRPVVMRRNRDLSAVKHASPSSPKLLLAALLCAFLAQMSSCRRQAASRWRKVAAVLRGARTHVENVPLVTASRRGRCGQARSCGPHPLPAAFPWLLRHTIRCRLGKAKGDVGPYSEQEQKRNHGRQLLMKQPGREERL